MILGIFLFSACDLDSPPVPGDTEERVFEVPKGATARGLAGALQKEQLVHSATKWEWWLRTGPDGGCIKAGKHRVNRGMSAAELLEALCGAPIADDVPFTVVEGWRIRDIDAALAAKGLIEAGDYIAAAKPGDWDVPFDLPKSSIEGYLFPETYLVSPDRFDAHAFIARQLSTFGERWGAAAAKAHGERKFSDVVILASMVEREEPSPTNRALVAGIIWKRLDSDWNLGIDATSRYSLPDWNDREAFLGKLEDATDPYNTRLRGGLPPTPIGNPGIAALDAALKPESSEYWYYLHDKNGVLHPSRNVKEHEAFRRKYGIY
jgi:UPF0755 protein